jgi:hypothetical protein
MEDLSEFNHNTCILLSLSYENTKSNNAVCHLKYMWKDNLKMYNFKHITTLKDIMINYHNPLICINMQNETNELRKQIMTALKEDDGFIRSYDDGRKKTLLKPLLRNVNRFINICESYGVNLNYSGFNINNNNLMFNNTILINNILKNRNILIEDDNEYNPTDDDSDDDDSEDDDSEDDDSEDDDSEDDDSEDDDVIEPPPKRRCLRR